MTSSNGNIFRVTGPLCGEFTGPGEFPTQRPVTRSFDVFFDIRLNKRLSKQPWGWWFETLSWSLWYHCNVLMHWRYCSLALSHWYKYLSTRSTKCCHKIWSAFDQNQRKPIWNHNTMCDNQNCNHYPNCLLLLLKQVWEVTLTKPMCAITWVMDCPQRLSLLWNVIFGYLTVLFQLVNNRRELMLHIWREKQQA